jgi:hypothetical protein
MAKKWKSKGGEITGHLDIYISDYEDENEGEIQKWREVQIHGDPEGLRSFARLINKIANLDQETWETFPIGAREHYHLRPNLELSKSSVGVIVGRIDAKGTGRFYDSFVAKNAKEIVSKINK